MSAPCFRGGVGVHSIARVELEVPDLATARDFYTTFGLDASPGDTGLDFKGRGTPIAQLRVVEGARKQLRALVLEADADAIAQIRGASEAKGVRCEAPRWAVEDALWLHDPDGNLISVRPAPLPDLPAVPSLGLAAPAPPRRLAADAGPQCMSHAMLLTPDVLRAVGFYEQVLGLRLSDRAADIVAFTHGAAGGDHHLVAFAKSHAPAFHHVSWEVASLDEVGLGARRMQDAGHTEGWGVGRHVLGSNYFYYAQDPWGSFCEFSYGIDQIAADTPWAAGDHAPEDALYLWGPEVPPSFLQNSEVPLDA